MVDSIDVLLEQANKGDSNAQYTLGVCYANGDGVEKDPVEAAKWYLKAAEQGYAKAQYNIAICYDNGYGVGKDSVEATRWYKKAAEQGHVKAQYNTGLCYANGDGVEKDYVQAVNWFEKAAQQDHIDAQINLGVCYDNGYGVERDYVQATKWFTKAAEQGDSTAQTHVGNCYYSGKGVERDYVQATKWFTKAAEQGNPNAQEFLLLIKKTDTMYEQFVREKNNAEKNNATTAEEYQNLATLFSGLDGYKNSVKLAKECEQKATEIERNRKNTKPLKEIEDEIKSEEEAIHKLRAIIKPGEAFISEADRLHVSGKERELLFLKYLEHTEDQIKSILAHSRKKLSQAESRLQKLKNEIEVHPEVIELRYNSLVQRKNNKDTTEDEYQKLSVEFKSGAMNGYKDAAELASECEKQYQILKEQREEQEKYKKYTSAVRNFNELEGGRGHKSMADFNRMVEKYESLATIFRSIPNYQDSANYAIKCKNNSNKWLELIQKKRKEEEAKRKQSKRIRTGLVVGEVIVAILGLWMISSYRGEAAMSLVFLIPFAILFCIPFLLTTITEIIRIVALIAQLVLCYMLFNDHYYVTSTVQTGLIILAIVSIMTYFINIWWIIKD